MGRNAEKHCNSPHIPQVFRSNLKCKRGCCSSDELASQDDPLEDGSQTTEHSIRVFMHFLLLLLTNALEGI